MAPPEPLDVSKERRKVQREEDGSVIYSDNGTNFTGVNATLKQLDCDQIQKETNLHNIEWKFIPPSALWWDAFWERLIRILKDHLKRNLGRASLTYEELNTFLCECEAIMNNRPVTYLSEDPSALKVLTPSMFLQSLPGNQVNDLDQIENVSLVRRLNYVQSLREKLRMRLKREYLGLLKSPKRRHTDIVKVGDIVLISNDKTEITLATA
ncbi:hypothetical protein AVEN_151572-1 [Araneus ventricosus]|uniref:Integrase catalytic domain-containing protein n=1 Tax=Araneus ventricosus TaxID=182803 RepID=A0A4Y2HXQ6_ARAVE|nr:hypothetical protein AVEN_151572-1 [Araneus ventricosus]